MFNVFENSPTLISRRVWTSRADWDQTQKWGDQTPKVEDQKSVRSEGFWDPSSKMYDTKTVWKMVEGKFQLKFHLLEFIKANNVFLETSSFVQID